MCAKKQRARRIDLSKPQVVSSAVAAYVRRSDEELADMAARADKCLSALTELKAGAEVFSTDDRCLDPGLLPADVCTLTGKTPADLKNLAFDQIFEMIRHVRRMSVETQELHRIKREKLFNQSITRALYGGGLSAPGGTLPGLFSGKKNFG